LTFKSNCDIIYSMNKLSAQTIKVAKPKRTVLETGRFFIFLKLFLKKVLTN
jgi:hypothetical protein